MRNAKENSRNVGTRNAKSHRNARIARPSLVSPTFYIALYLKSIPYWFPSWNWKYYPYLGAFPLQLPITEMHLHTSSLRRNSKIAEVSHGEGAMS